MEEALCPCWKIKGYQNLINFIREITVQNKTSAVSDLSRLLMQAFPPKAVVDSDAVMTTNSRPSRTFKIIMYSAGIDIER